MISTPALDQHSISFALPVNFTALNFSAGGHYSCRYITCLFISRLDVQIGAGFTYYFMLGLLQQRVTRVSTMCITNRLEGRRFKEELQLLSRNKIFVDVCYGRHLKIHCIDPWYGKL